MLMLGGAGSAWADGSISIPQELGSYILIGNGSTNTTATGVTLYNAQVDGSSESSYTVGSTHNGSTITFALTNSTQQNYILSFVTGSQYAATATATLSDGGSYSQEKNFTITNTGAWSLTESHFAEFTNVPTGSLTLTLSLATSGSYAGNYGNFCFHTASQYNAFPLKSSSSYIQLNSGTYGGGCSSEGENVGSIRDGASAEYVVYNSNAKAKYLLNMGVAYYGEGTMNVTVTDILSNTAEVSQSFSVPNVSNYANALFPLASAISAGLKKIRFDFSGTGNSNGYILNYKNVTFGTYDVMPMMTATPTYIPLDNGVYGGTGTPRTENSGTNVGYVYNGGYAEYYVLNENETAYYNLCLGITRYQDNSRLKVTVTDVATGTDEEQETFDVPSASNYATCMFKLANAISAGIKKIRFDFINTTTDSYIFNYKNLSFYKCSLNEAYDYTPVAASGVDVVLTRSITAGKWSTICLPFDMTAEQVTTTFGTGVKLAAVSSYDSGNKVLSTETATTIKANEPCFIKVASDFSSATISGVTIEDATPEKVISGDFKMVGTYASGSIPSGAYFVSNNQLFKSNGTDNIKPFRAYFAHVPAGARLVFFDDETTGISAELNDKAEMTNDNTFFDLQGRRVTQPTKGLYILNGRKVIIK